MILHTSRMTKRHLPQCLEIEKDANAYPWSMETFAVSLEDSSITCEVIGPPPLYNIELVEIVLGYMIYHESEEHIYVINLCVAPAYHRQGIGTNLVESLKARLSPAKSVLSVILRESNVKAQLFSRGLGFKYEPPTQYGFFTETEEGGYYMRYDFVTEANEQACLTA